VKRTIQTTVALLTAAGALAACSSDEVTAPEIEVIEETTFHPSLEVDLSRMTQTASGIYIEDVVVGTGAVAEPGDEASVRFAGFLSDGTQFDAGDFSFTLGSGQVIPGFDEGVRGMAVGGARKVLIPPALAYGNAGSGPIPGGAILVFDIQLLDVNKTGS